MLNKRFSGIMLVLLLACILASNIQPAEASVTMDVPIYIRADGTIEPEGAPISTTDNVTYTLTSDIVCFGMDYETGYIIGIVVERNNIILDGRNYALEGVPGNILLEPKGLYFYGINNVTIMNMTIKKFFYGIYLYNSSNNIILGNNLINNIWSGVYLASDCVNNTISGNNITNNNVGIAFENYCDNNSITENNITNNNNGISLKDCGNNRIIGNNITNNNSSGIYIHGGGSQNNTIYQNNFINNTQQANVDTISKNVWDNGTYGNYWSDYTGWDGVWILGFVVGRDGIGDQPYVINEANKDRYPVTTNWPPPDMGQVAIVIVLVIVVVGASVTVFILRKRKRKKA